MARPLRPDFPGAVWHLFHRGNEQKNIFRSDRDRRRFLDLLAETVRRYRWILYDYELMPNHYHLIVETPETTVSRGMQFLNGRYAQLFNKVHHRVGHLFQGRFDGKVIEKQTQLLTVVRYVALNAVHAKIVERPEQYAWGGYRANAGLKSPPPKWLATDRLLELFAPDHEVAQRYYRAFVEEKIDDPTSIWDAVVGQIYLGSESWTRQMRTRVESALRSDDHPRAQREIGRPNMPTIVAAVARACSIDESAVRNGHGGMPRSVAAWLGCYEGLLWRRAITAGLRLASSGRASDLIRLCDRAIDGDPLLRATIDRCCDLLRAAPPLPLTTLTASPAVLR